MATAELPQSLLARQAREQLRAILAELAALAEQDCDEASYCSLFVERASLALAAHGSALWKRQSNGGLRLLVQHQWPVELADQSAAAAQNAQHLFRALAANEPLLIDPKTDPNGQATKAVADGLLIVAPIRLGGEAVYVLEVLQRNVDTPQIQRGYAALAGQLADLASVYLKNRQLRELLARQEMWQQLDQFHQAIHGSLDLKQVCYAIANEGRTLIGCDRVSVALARSSQCRVVAVSGQDTVDSRAVLIRRLDALATMIAQTGQPFWYSGQQQPLSPQVQAALEDYLDQAHCKRVGLVPLVPRHVEEIALAEQVQRPLGVLIVEQIADASSLDDWQQRTEAIVAQVVPALRNAQLHSELFLFPVWQKLGRLQALLAKKTRAKTLAAAAAVAVMVAALVLVPFDFTVHAPGTLQPSLRREVFAAVDGTVDRVFVKHGQHVAQGELLVQLRNTDLDVEITELMGQTAATQEQLASIDRSLVEDAKRLSPEERNRLAGQRSELRQRLASLAGQLELRQLKRKQLQVRSPVAGEITTWNIEQLLDERPVKQGQALLNVSDTSAKWELELRLPEARMGFLAQAQSAQATPLGVTYRLATDPGTDHLGAIADVHLVAEIRGEEQNTVLVRVQLDEQSPTHLQPGAECRAKIHCGQRALGYVLLHDLWAFIQSRILFRL